MIWVLGLGFWFLGCIIQGSYRLAAKPGYKNVVLILAVSVILPKIAAKYNTKVYEQNKYIRKSYQC